MDVEAGAATSTTVLEDVLEGCLSGVFEGSDGSSNDGGAGLGELGSDEGNALDVLVSVLAREAEFGRKLRANSLTEKEGDRAAAVLVEGDLEGAGDGVLARVVETSNEDGEALLVSGRILLSEDLDNGFVREPVRDGLKKGPIVSSYELTRKVSEPRRTAPVLRRRRSSVPEMSRV